MEASVVIRNEHVMESNSSLQAEDEHQQPSPNRDISMMQDENELISKLDQEYIDELKVAFEHADINNSGTIQTSELMVLLRNLGLNPTDSEMQDIVNEFDFNGNGSVDFQEFLVFMAKRDEWRCEDDIKYVNCQQYYLAFQVFDPENVGYLDVKEIREIMMCDGQCLNEEEIKEILANVDLDANGKVEYHEFAELMLRGHITK